MKVLIINRRDHFSLKKELLMEIVEVIHAVREIKITGRVKCHESRADDFVP